MTPPQRRRRAGPPPDWQPARAPRVDRATLPLVRRAKRGWHREALESLLAVAVVAALVAVLSLLFGKPSPHTPGPTATGTTSPAARTPGPTAAGTTSPAPGTPGGSGVRTTSPPPTAIHSPATTSPTPARVPVLVLNNSRIKGLAARAAAVFRAGGWPVGGTGNLRGRTPVTTVYYPIGEEVTARLFAARFPAIRRVLPRPPGLPGSGLTVVVTREYRT